MPPQSRSRTWCFTFNSYSVETVETLSGLFSSDEVTYACFQPEIGESGTRHLQGFVCSNTARTLGGIKRHCFGDAKSSVHLAAMRGTPEQSKAYCSKEDSRDLSAGFEFKEFGDIEGCPLPVGAGNRGDLDSIISRIKENASLREVALEFPTQFIRYERGIRSWFDIYHLPDRPRVAKRGSIPDRPRFLWFHGSTGSGKSFTVLEEAGDRDVYWKPEGKWWDGYSQQPVVAFDDFRGGDIGFASLLRLTDHYDMRVEVKGGFRLIGNLELVIITSPNEPHVVFSGLAEANDGKLDQLLRRIDEIRNFPPRDTGVVAAIAPFAPLFNPPNL